MILELYQNVLPLPPQGITLSGLDASFLVPYLALIRV